MLNHAPIKNIKMAVKNRLPAHSICKQCANNLRNPCYWEARKVSTINGQMGITECSGFKECK